MIRYQVAGRYSMALFKAPCTPEMLEKRLQILEEIEKYIDQNPKFSLYLYAPEIAMEEKEAFLQKILRDEIDPLLMKFIFFLIKRKRLECIDEINMKYRQQVSKFLGILNVNVISAIPLGDSEKEALKLKIERINPGKKIVFKEKVDPEIIGGLIVVIDHRIIDLSVKNTLAQMKEQLLAAPV